MDIKKQLTCDRKGQAHDDKPVTTNNTNVIRSPSEKSSTIPMTNSKNITLINNNNINSVANNITIKSEHNKINVNEIKTSDNNDDDDDENDNDNKKTNDNSDDDNEAVKCIFLCEFHATAGPKIAAQVPENYISKELFDTFYSYIIPKLQLQRSFLSVSLLGKKILGYPVRIDNKQYARNAFYFNFCFVFAPNTRTVVYEPVVRKLTEYMLSMELSTKMLSQVNDAAQMTRLSRILAQIRRDINRKKMCMLQEGSSIIPLCVVPLYRDIPIVHPHSAAVLLNEFHKYVHTQWDLTTLRILPYVNGFNHIHRIAAMADVALGLVVDCITHLVLLGVAIVVPVFQYCNIYRPTPKLSQLAKCKRLQELCIEKCSKSNRKQAKLRDVFRMFASMAHGATFGELCVRFNPAVLNINEKQMVLFGLLEGLIRRVDKYPVTVSRDLFFDDEDIHKKHFGNKLATITTTSAAASAAANIDAMLKDRISRPLPRDDKVAKKAAQHSAASNNNNNNSNNTQSQQFYYNGLVSFDELCCTRGISSQQLETQLVRDRHVIVLLK